MNGQSNDQLQSSDTRRKLLQALGLAGGTALAGCLGGGENDSGEGGDGGDDSSSGTDGGSGGASGSLQRGGTLRLGQNTQLQSLSPVQGITTAKYVLREAAYSRLTRVNADLKLEPDIATDWESNDAKDEWTFMLTEDAVFANTDGRSLIAEDVKATIDLMLSEDRAEGAGDDLGAFDSVEVEDDYRITINLSSPDLLYPKRIAEFSSRFVILPKNVIESQYDELSSTDFGTGPFTITEYNPGSDLQFEANEEYHRTDDEGRQLPYLDNQTWKFVVDPTAQANALTDKRIDAIQLTPPSQLDALANEDSVTTDERESLSFISIVMNTTVENENGERPFADPKVRKAIKYATNLEEMAQAADNNITPNHHGPLTPSHELYPDFPVGLEFGVQSKPDKARQMLEEAGYGDGLQLPTMYYSPEDSPARGPTSILFQEQMSNFGIEFDIQQLTNDVWLADYWNKDNVWYASGYAGRMMSTTVHELAFHSEMSPWNSGRWSNEEYDAAHERMLNAGSQEELADALAEAERIHHMEGTWLVTGAETYQTSYQDYVNNVNMYPASSADFHSEDWLTSDAPMGPN